MADPGGAAPRQRPAPGAPTGEGDLPTNPNAVRADRSLRIAAPTRRPSWELVRYGESVAQCRAGVPTPDDETVSLDAHLLVCEACRGGDEPCDVGERIAAREFDLDA